MSNEQIYLAGEVALWLQLECGSDWIFLGCHNVTGVSAPRGDTNPIFCRIGKNQYAIQRTWRGTPGLGSLTIEAYDTVLNYIQELACAFNLVVLHSSEGGDDDPTNFDYLYYYNGVEVTSVDTDTHVSGINQDTQTPIMLSMPASFRERVKVKKLTAQATDLSAYTTDDVLDISFCDAPSCDQFGNLSTIGCQVGYAVTSGGATADILKTTDGGGTWSVIASPFTDANDDIHKVICSDDTVVVLNGTSSAYAYSWDAGATWTQVTTPTVILNAAVMMTGVKIWFCGNSGWVYYSGNRGSTVSGNQIGSENFNSIDAADSLILYVVGDNNEMYKSTNGGTTWTAVTGPSVGNNLMVVSAVAGSDILFVGDNLGNVYRSDDQGATWTTSLATNTNLAGGITGIAICDCNVITIAGNDLEPYYYPAADGVVYQSVDGGQSWLGVEVPSNAGINSLQCCDVNRYWAALDGSKVLNISGATITT